MTGGSDGGDAGRLEDLSPEARELYRVLRERGESGAEGGAAPGRPGSGAGPGPSRGGRDPIPPLPGDARAPLSPTQARLWSLGQMVDPAWGNVPVLFRLRGSVDPGVLDQALRRVVRRQQALRTLFVSGGGAPVQHVADVPERVLERAGDRPREATEVSAGPTGTGEGTETGVEAARERAVEAARRPFRLDREIPVRAGWEPVDAEEGLFWMVIHHLAADGWSMGVLLEELSEVYRALASGREPALPDLPVQYRDYSAWAASRAAEGVPAESLEYWREALKGAPPELELPPGGRRGSPRQRAFDTGRLEVRLEGAAAGRLREVAREEGVTLFTALLGAFQAFLGRWTGSRDVVVGTTLSMRSRPEVERLIGNFGNNVLLRGDLGGRPSYRELLGRLQPAVAGAQAHGDVPLERLISELADRVRVPRFHVMFMLRQDSPEAFLSLPDVEVSHRPLHTGTGTLDLTLDLWDGDEALGGFLEYSAARFREQAARAVREGLVASLEAVARDPDAPLEDLLAPLVPDVASEPTSGPGESGGAQRSASPAAAGAPRAGSEPPSGATEEWLAGLWEEALGVEEVSAHDNFFDLGGHSLLAVSVLERIEAETGCRLTPVDLVSQSLRQVAAACRQAAGDGRPGPGATAPDRRRAPAPDAEPPADLPAAELEVRPHYFGPDDSPLFGVHHPSPGGEAGPVVVCPPVGHEYQQAHRALRSLAERVAEAGRPVLRFDYFGTGDSSGESGDATLQRWLRDVAAAADRAAELGRGRPVSLVGLRLGAALALRAARRLPVEALVLWDPPASGDDYMEHLSRRQEAWHRGYRAGTLDEAPDARSGHFLGFPVEGALEREIRELDPLEAPPPRPERALVVSGGASAGAGRLGRRMGDAGVEVDAHRYEGEAVWDQDPDIVVPAMPVDVLKEIAAWLS